MAELEERKGSMKEIIQKARKERTIYGCSYCKRINVRKATMIQHEAMCYYNPERSVCPWCGDSSSGVEVIHDYGTGQVTQSCPKCDIWKSIHEPDDYLERHKQERIEMAREA